MKLFNSSVRSFVQSLVAASVAMVVTLSAVPAFAQSPVAPPAKPSGFGSSLQPDAFKIDTRLTVPSKTGGIIQLDRIIAVVNNEVITLNDLNDRMSSVAKQLQKQGTTLPAQDVLQKQLLEQMINTQVQLQEAKETGIRVDDGTLDKTLQRIADENNVSMTEFRRLLEQDGIGWSKFREEIRGEVMMSRLQEREIEGNIAVTEAEIDTQLALEAREATADQEFRLAHILVQVPEQATSEQIEVRRKRAVQALGELRKGTEFAQVSAQFSDAPDALQGGNLGWRASGRIGCGWSGRAPSVAAPPIAYRLRAECAGRESRLAARA